MINPGDVDVRTDACFSALIEDRSLFARMSPAQRRSVGELLRDHFFARVADRTGEEGLFRTVVDAIDPPPILEVEGLGLSFHPTARYKRVRFLDADRIGPAFRSLFARPSVKMPHLVAAFVDPEELSFRTFENIVPFDRFFGRNTLELALVNVASFGERSCTFTVAANEPLLEVLGQLDALDLYVPPLQTNARGGLRFIFHSARLADLLTTALKRALPAEQREGFCHVNPIFRCNRFEPSDAPFLSHLDTPYYDAARRQISRYTLLIYLTGGQGSPVLRVGNERLEKVGPMTAVIFPQDLEHEGAAFAEGRKVFLRTELIYEGADLVDVPNIGRLFAQACYLTGESLFHPELARYEKECYDRAARAHWRGLEAAEDGPFLRKEFRGFHFIANGYDFWFPKGPLSVAECATVALLDVFNCKVGGEPFRALCKASPVTPSPRDPAWIGRCLAPYGGPPAEPLFSVLNKVGLFPPPEHPMFCCPFHCYSDFDATRCGDVIEAYEDRQAEARTRIGPAPILMMGDVVFLDPDRFVVESGRIFILSERRLAPVNFAACWNWGGWPTDYVGMEARFEVPDLLVPPILFSEDESTIHLVFDFFRNGWMVNQHVRSVDVMKVLNRDPAEVEGYSEEFRDEDEPDE